MIYRKFIGLLALLAIGIACAPGAAAGAVSRRAQAKQLLGTLQCQTTRANRSWFSETDTIDSIGRWLHGTARPIDAQHAKPFYDYYLAYVRKAHSWIYIQIDPVDGTYFVGTSPGGPHGSLNNSVWRIVFPAEQNGYTFTESAQRFQIAYSDLTQVCTMVSTATPALPAPTLRCDTYKADGSSVPVEYLSISEPAGNVPWWQGIATDAGGRVVYEYNIFTIRLQRISVLINGVTGSYAIATSRLAPNLNDTSWTVVYPTVEDGFTFSDVRPLNALPQRMTINFKDGYQRCVPIAQ
jgi:hypothetical protein